MIRMTPPVLPLMPARFRRALRTGHGRAMQQLLRYGAAGFEKSLLHACAWCPVYDPQCEGDRAGWIVDMVSRVALGAQAVAVIRRAGERANRRATSWDRDHRCSVLKELAERSVPEARELLYSSLAREPGTADVVAARQIAELDGADGLMAVARRMGTWLAQDPYFWVDSELLDRVEELQGAGTAWAVLKQASADDANVARYLAAVEQQSRRSQASPQAPTISIPGLGKGPAGRWVDVTAGEVIAHVRTDPPGLCAWLNHWGRSADADSRATVFAALLEEVEPRRVARFLRAFIYTGPPRFDDRLLAWIDAPEEDLSYFAGRVLSHVAHPRVREAALQMLSSGEAPDGAIPLLHQNFEPSDHELIEAVLQRPAADDDVLFSRLHDAVALFEAHPCPELAGSAWFVYEHSPCSCCRLRALKLLASTGTLPPWIADEARLDANEKIRSLVLEHVETNGA